MPFITFALCYILYDERLFKEWQIWAIAFPVIYAIGYLSFRMHYVYDHALHTRFPSVSETRKRVFYTIPINLLVMTPSVF